MKNNENRKNRYNLMGFSVREYFQRKMIVPVFTFVMVVLSAVLITCENGKPIWFDQYDNFNSRYKLCIINNTSDTLRLSQSVSMIKRYPTTIITFDSLLVIPPDRTVIDSVYYEYVALVGEENQKPVYKLTRSSIQQEYVEGTIVSYGSSRLFRNSIVDTNDMSKSSTDGYWLMYCDQKYVNYDTITINPNVFKNKM